MHYDETVFAEDLFLEPNRFQFGDYESNESLQEKFWSCVQKPSKDACWIWQGELDKAGYGYLRIDYFFLSAHRTSWKIHYGKIPKNFFVLHKCDNPSCVNPEHLWLGNNADNINDSVRKGRFHKSTAKRMSEIKQLSKRSFLTQKIITKMFNISFNFVNGIALDTDWSYSKIKNIS